MNEQRQREEKASSTPATAPVGFGLCVVCIAVSVTTGLLALSVLIVIFEVPIGIKPLTIGVLLASLYKSLVVPVFVLIGDILRSFSPWGFIALLAVLLLLKGPMWLRRLIGASRWKVAGFEFDGTSSSSVFQKELSEAAEIVERANREIDQAYRASTSFASTLRDRYQVGELTSNLSKEIAALVGPACPSDYKMTIYIPDLVFGDRLYQFTEYYDAVGGRVTDGKAGRTFSVRYGIIGRVWRSGVSEIEGQLLPDGDRKRLDERPEEGPVEKFIARQWGLSLQEAIQIRDYNSYGAVRVDVADAKVGEVFFYSKKREAFGDESARADMLKKIDALLDTTGVRRALWEVSQHVAPWSGRISIFKNS